MTQKFFKKDPSLVMPSCLSKGEAQVFKIQMSLPDKGSTLIHSQPTKDGPGIQLDTKGREKRIRVGPSANQPKYLMETATKPGWLAWMGEDWKAYFIGVPIIETKFGKPPQLIAVEVIERTGWQTW